MRKKLTGSEAKALLEQYRSEDPIYNYKPGATFSRATECLSRFVCIKAVNQIGKTAWLQYICSALLRNKHPARKSSGPVHGLLVVPARAQAAEVWGKRLLRACELAGPIGKHPWLPKRELKQGGVNWAYSPVGKYPGKITMRDGSTLIVILSGDPNSWKRLEGMTFDFIIRDEVAGSENLGDELQPRLIRSYSKALSGETQWGGIMIWAATETKFNQEWNDFKQRATDGVQDYALFAPQPEEASAYVAMEAREAMRKSMSAASFSVRGSGTADAGEFILIYGKQWDDKRHIMQKMHDISSDDNIWLSWDPGVEHPTGILIAVTSRDKPRQIKCVQAFFHSRESIDFDIECIDQFILGRKIAGFIYDYAAKNRSKTGAPSVRDVLIQKMEAKGYDPILGYIAADKRHAEGINMVREYLDPDPYNKNAEPLLVLSPVTMENGMGQARAELISYRGKESTNFTGAGGVVKKNDEFCDISRYLCRASPTWSPALRCGPAKKQPNYTAPATVIAQSSLSLSKPNLLAKMSSGMARRSKQSVAREWDPRYIMR